MGKVKTKIILTIEHELADLKGIVSDVKNCAFPMDDVELINTATESVPSDEE